MKIVPALFLTASLVLTNPGSLHGITKEKKDLVWDVLKEENPWEFYWKWKMRSEKIEVWDNFFAIYDFSEYVIFEQDMADARDHLKKKRYIIYAKKWPDNSLIFTGIFHWNTTPAKNTKWDNGIHIHKIKKMPKNEGIEEILELDYRRYLKENPLNP